MHRASRLALSLLALTAIPGCDPGISDKNLVYVTPLDVSQVLHPPSTVFSHPAPGVWVDPRLRPAYLAGHVPGAISIPFPEMLNVAKQELKDYGSVVVYDTNYDDILGRAGAKRLLEMGFKQVYVLKGGLEAWKQAGHPVASGPNPDGTAAEPSEAATPAAPAAGAKEP